MKAKKNSIGEYIVTIPQNVYSYAEWDQYIETKNAQQTNRLLDNRIDDDGEYDCEYSGSGTVDGIPVTSIYLLDTDDYNLDKDGIPDNDTNNWDWSTAARRGRLIVITDDLTEDEYDALRRGDSISR